MSGRVVVRVERGVNLRPMDINGKSDPYVRVLLRGSELTRTPLVVKTNNPTWSAIVDLGQVKASESVTFIVMDNDALKSDDLIGLATVTIADLVRRPAMELMLVDRCGDVVTQHLLNQQPVSFLHVNLVSCEIPDLPVPTLWSARAARAYPLHAMCFTRGTRGDIQPFIALARGLAEKLGWMVTICTELAYKDSVKKWSAVSQGCIRFRPSGGDTTARTDTPMAKWAMNTSTEIMQALMLSRSEAEFFASEPAMFHWASTLKPDVVIFGFTVANIALIVHEALGIPIVGFVLQPTCIPSEAYPAVVSIPCRDLPMLNTVEKCFTSHSLQQWLKKQMQADLKNMRKRRGLRKYSGNTWTHLISMEIPLLVPMREALFGPKPKEWGPNTHFTDFIYLRSPTPASAGLEPALASFISKAKADGAPVVVMAFSSMPVARAIILEAGCRMAELCMRQPRVIALVGPRDQSSDSCSPELEHRVAELKAQHRLFEGKGAPFNELFPLMDALVVHGGLGTTSEALRIG
eukprot:RCo049347